MIVVQASSRSWAGGEDLCMRQFDGVPAVAHTVRAARRHFPDTPLRLVAPAFDRGGPFDAIAAQDGEDTEALYGFDASPLDRILMAVEPLPDEALVLRVDGLHFCTDFTLAMRMVDKAAAASLDGTKGPDDFPAQISPDVLRVGALRRARALITAADDPFLIHPKFLIASDPGFRFARLDQSELPEYSDSHLSAIRSLYLEMLSDDERSEVGEKGQIAHGDQLRYHYALAIRWLTSSDRVLDVACGNGFGTRMVAEHCAAPVGVDRDNESIALARAAAADDPSEYLIADALEMPFADATFDAVLSMETLEHLPPEPFLDEVRRVLAPGGLLILSTPQSRLGHIPLMPAHHHEFSLEELTELVTPRFEVLSRIGLKAGTIWFEGDPVGTNSFFVCRRP
jgi:SAM-dependent methyltransferase